MRASSFSNITATSLANHANLSYRRNKTLPPLPAVAAQSKTTHSMPPEKVEIFHSLESWASKNILPYLKPVDRSWQPSEFLPDTTRPVAEFMDEIQGLQDRTSELSDEVLVVLVGDMITEEALPTYQTMLNTFDGTRDETAASSSSWACWTRAWTAEENRHGDLLKTYLYLSGRVDMVMVERTLQYLIGAGMDVGLENNPYFGFVYTSFQERATFISHGNTARLAKDAGDSVLAQICGTIAADEKRHEKAYQTIIEKLLEIDPNDTMLAIESMMRKHVTMPAHLIYDGQDPQLFQHFSIVAQRLGVYTTNDYADILEFLIKRWKLEKLERLKSDGRHAQDFVCELPQRIRKLQERADERAKKIQPRRQMFSWIFNKEVLI